METVYAEDLRSVNDAIRLRLYLTDRQPDADAAGRHAFDAGVSKEQCPHPVQSAAWASWITGWQKRRDHRNFLTLIRNPMPKIRIAGDDAYEHQQSSDSNPYPDQDSAEHLNWRAGWNDAMQRNS